MNLRRILAALLLCGMLLFTAGCAFSGGLPDTSQEAGASPAANPNKYLEEFQQHWQYRYLSTVEQDCYGTVYTALTDGFEQDAEVVIRDEKSDTDVKQIGISIKLPHVLTTQEQAKRLYNAVFQDNPQFFYVSNRYGLEGFMQRDTTYYDTLVLVYTMKAADRKTAATRLEQAVNDILKGMPKTQDEFLNELYLHDRLTAACTYDKTAAKEGNDSVYPNAYTAYGALVDGRAVCEGYSRAMQMLLYRIDIPCTLVTGSSLETGEEHIWNLVTINSRNYHLDATWNDSDDRPSHAYMNFTTKRLLQSYKLNNEQTGIDTCTSTEDEYFLRKGLYIDSYHREDIADAIAAALVNSDDVIELRFSNKTFNNGLLFLKNTALTTQMVQASLQKAGHQNTKLWSYQLIGRTDQCTLMLIKK